MQRRREADNEERRTARAHETPQQTYRHREADTEATRTAHARETPEQTQRRRNVADQATSTARARGPQRSREAYRDATTVRRRIFPAAHSAVSNPSYVDFGNMDVERKNCRALRFVVERKIGSSEANSVFSNCCPSDKLTLQHIPLLQDPHSFLRELLTGSTPREGSARIL